MTLCQSRYLVKSILHASEVLDAFRSDGEVLQLRDIVARTGFKKGMCFRLVYTLHHCRFLDKVGENQYRRAGETRPRRRYRIGYAGQTQDASFAQEVRTGLENGAASEHVELLVIDNRYQPKIALRNADRFIRERVDLVIEFQTDEAVAPAIASKYLEAKIPFIAIDIPHPGGTYFGANNYDAGLLGGRALGRWARKHWDGLVDEVLLIELFRAGSLPRNRTRGMLAGIQEVLALPQHCPVVKIDGDGQFKVAFERVRKHLRESKAKRVLVGAANDPSALGALRAFEEAGRALDSVVVGQNGDFEARAELRVPSSRLIASVAYFPERYGKEVLRLGLNILAGKAVPPAAFIKHQLLTPDNIDHHYPNDAFLTLQANGLANSDLCILN